MRRARSGIFLHEVLERVPLDLVRGPTTFETWRELVPEVSRLFDETIAVHRVDRAQREHAERLAWGAFTTPIALPAGGTLDRLASAASLVREMDFVFPVGDAARVYVRGSLDLAFEHRALTYFNVVDWKTDSLASFERVFGTWRATCTRTTTTLGGAVRAGGGQAPSGSKRGGKTTRRASEDCFYCFLRGLDHERGAVSGPYRPSWDEIVAWAEALRNRAHGHGCEEGCG